MKKINLKYGLIALLAMGFSINVNAQDITCDGIEFNAQGFDAYEFIDQACQAVVIRDGALYAQLKAQIVSQAKSGTHIRYMHQDGTWGRSHLAKQRDFITTIEGKNVRVRDLAAKQEANVYIPAQFFTVAMAEEIIAEEIVEEVIEAVIEEEIMEEEAPVVLPTTAGPLPWLALFGSLFLMLGGALRLSRKQ
jgi:hypothetical protein